MKACPDEKTEHTTLSERRPLWSDGGSYCAGCRKFVFSSEETAQEKLEDLKGAMIYFSE
jgi:hypothetical protein